MPPVGCVVATLAIVGIVGVFFFNYVLQRRETLNHTAGRVSRGRLILFSTFSQYCFYTVCMKSQMEVVQQMLAPAGIRFNGPDPWDPHIHDEHVFDRMFSHGIIAIGESYMDRMWDVADIPEMVSRVMRSRAIDRLRGLQIVSFAIAVARSVVFNLQNKRKAWEVAEKHYDIGNDLYERMLDKRMVYSCGYWADAKTLDEAQEAKLDLVCRKIGLKKGDRILDIGCGWGSFAIFAAEKYGVSVVGVTISKEQAVLAKERAAGLPVEIRLQDYRDITDGPFDHVISIGMFEHVGRKNYRTFFETVRRLLKDDGLFLLHTIGAKQTLYVMDPWMDKYIFPNGYLPSAAQIAEATDTLFALEDWHNFGPDYEKTLLAWFKNFDARWPELREIYGERFYRMWKFYLLGMAGTFRSRQTHLWQIVLSPNGVPGGYTSIR